MKATSPMTIRDLHRAELRELAAELARPAAGRSHGSDPATGSGDRPETALEIEKLIGELQGQLADAAEDAEEIVTAHPLAAVATALLLGIVIGRMVGRR